MSDPRSSTVDWPECRIFQQIPLREQNDCISSPEESLEISRIFPCLDRLSLGLPADAESLRLEALANLTRNQMVQIATWLGTELSQTELEDLHETAHGFVGQEWNYLGTDAGEYWVVFCSLPPGARLVANGIPEDISERVRMAMEMLAENS